jgi:hypothetical protein
MKRATPKRNLRKQGTRSVFWVIGWGKRQSSSQNAFTGLSSAHSRLSWRSHIRRKTCLRAARKKSPPIGDDLLLLKKHPYGQQKTTREVELLKNPSLKNLYRCYAFV